MIEHEFKLKPLVGHTTPETAYIVEDYPYGFRLRCRIRYWLEYKYGQGFRLCSETTNPKTCPGDIFGVNKPKKSTYALLGVMGLDKKNHLTWTTVDVYMYDGEKLEAFRNAYGSSFDENQNKVWNAMKKAYDRYMESAGIDDYEILQQ
jgi:hypothetical protein